MSKTNELQNTTKIVKEVLKDCPEARNSDDILISVVCKRINPICAGLSFDTVLLNRKALGLPVFESIRRAGQKVREHHPELEGSERVKAHRKKSEQAHIDYARGLV